MLQGTISPLWPACALLWLGHNCCRCACGWGWPLAWLTAIPHLDCCGYTSGEGWSPQLAERLNYSSRGHAGVQGSPSCGWLWDTATTVVYWWARLISFPIHHWAGVILEGNWSHSFEATCWVWQGGSHFRVGTVCHNTLWPQYLWCMAPVALLLGNRDLRLARKWYV